MSRSFVIGMPTLRMICWFVPSPMYTRQRRNMTNALNVPAWDRCPNLVKGHRSILYLHGLSIKSSYRSCEKWEAAQAQRRRENLIQSHHIPKEITAASFASFERDPERLDALEAVLEFCRSVEPGTSATRGVYLYGPLGWEKAICSERPQDGWPIAGSLPS